MLLPAVAVVVGTAFATTKVETNENVTNKALKETSGLPAAVVRIVVLIRTSQARSSPASELRRNLFRFAQQFAHLLLHLRKLVHLLRVVMHVGDAHLWRFCVRRREKKKLCGFGFFKASATCLNVVLQVTSSEFKARAPLVTRSS